MNRLTALVCLAALASPLALSPAWAATECEPWALLKADGAQPTPARVAATGRVPISVEAPTRGHPFLVTGNHVVILASDAGRACVTYTAPSKAAHSTTGWVDARAIQPDPDASGSGDWSGTWRSGPEQEIRISAAGTGAYKVEGSATFGASDPARVARGAVNEGNIAGAIHPSGSEADLSTGSDPTDCRVRFWRIGTYLVAAGNGDCGGENVTFTGSYRQSKK
jgi:hypothetical protein